MYFFSCHQACWHVAGTQCLHDNSIGSCCFSSLPIETENLRGRGRLREGGKKGERHICSIAPPVIKHPSYRGRSVAQVESLYKVIMLYWVHHHLISVNTFLYLMLNHYFPNRNWEVPPPLIYTPIYICLLSTLSHSSGLIVMFIVHYLGNTYNFSLPVLWVIFKVILKKFLLIILYYCRLFFT